MSIEKIYDWLSANLRNRVRKLSYRLPLDMRFRARKLYYLPYDLYKTITGQRHPYEPPGGDIYTGGRRDYINDGRQQFSLLERYVGIKPDDQVLDIGSGTGRTAVPFTGFLNENGRYEGFDVVEKGVNWCNAKIKRDHPNFNFTYTPLNNDFYNTSPANASEFHFPYADEQFDLAFLFSVFTHMQTEEIDHYLTEIFRVLKPGGKCLATFFLYKEEDEEVSANPRTQFPIKKEGYRLMDDNMTMAAIAISRRKLEQMLGGVALEVIQEVEGFWRQEQWQHPTKTNQISGGLSYQDVVVLEKSKGIQKTQAVI